MNVCRFTRIAACTLCAYGAAFSQYAGAADPEAMDRCLLEQLKSVESATTAAEMRATCERSVAPAAGVDSGAFRLGTADKPTALEQRLSIEYSNVGRQFDIMTHRSNFLMYSYNGDPNQKPFEGIIEDPDPVDDSEMVFQVSFKMPLAQKLFDTNTDLYGAFTSKSWWQLFNDKFSSPFRETNYEPELFVRHYGGPEILGLQVAGWDFGFNHQSNGREQELSRSWNRIMGQVAFDLGDITAALRVWHRLSESEEDDDNPAMWRYYGYGDLKLAYAPNRNTFTLMLRQGTQNGAVDFTWSYPVTRFIRAYAQYFDGYGESLLDYNVHTRRVGIGIALNDVLQR